MQSLNQFVTDIFARRFQALQALIRVSIIAFHIHPNLRRAAIVSDVDSGHAHQTNTRIGQFSFDQRFDLLPQGFANPPTMIFQPALLHETAPQVKRMRISENPYQVCDSEELLSRALRQRDKYGGNNVLEGCSVVLSRQLNDSSCRKSLSFSSGVPCCWSGTSFLAQRDAGT